MGELEVTRVRFADSNGKGPLRTAGDWPARSARQPLCAAKFAGR